MSITCGAGRRTWRSARPTTAVTASSFLPIGIHSNEIVGDRDRSFKDGTPQRIDVDARDYLWRLGLKDVHVETKWSPRPLTPAIEQQIITLLDNARGDWAGVQAREVMRHPQGMSPGDLLKSFTTEIKVGLEHASSANGRQVPEYMAQTDAIFRQGLAGKALLDAQAAIEDARKVG